MMGGIGRCLRAELRARWRVWGAIAVLIGLAGGVVLTTAAGARRTDTAYTRYLAASNASDVLISPRARGRPRFYDAVEKLPQVASAATLVGLSTFMPDRDNFQIQAVVSADGKLARTIERPKLVAGRMYRPDRADEAVADRNLANALHLKAGSRLHVFAAATTPEGGPQLDQSFPIDLTIVGIAVTRENVVPVNALASLPTLMGTPALLRDVERFYDGKPFQYDSYDGAFVRLKAGASKSEFTQQAEELAQQFPEAGAPLFVADQHAQAAKVQRAIRPQATALALFSLLAAIASLFVIGQIVSRQLFLASSDHPTLKALGMGRTQLLAIHLGQVVLVAGVGAALAVLISVAASPFMPIGPARLAEPHPGFAANWAIIGLGAVAIVALLLIREAWPAWRLATSPTSVQGGVPIAGDERPSRLLEAVTRAGAPATTSVGMRLALEPGRGRTAVPVRSALAGTVLAVAAVAAAFTFGTNLVRLVHTPKLYGQQWDLAADSQFGKLDRARTDAFFGDHGVAAWTYGDYADLTVAGKPVPAIALQGAHGHELWPKVIEGRTPQAPDELIVGTKTLDAIHRSVGDTVEVTPEQGDAQPMHIVGRATFPFFGRGSFGTLGLGEGAAMQDDVAPTGSCDQDSPGAPCGFNFVLARLRAGSGRAATLAALRRELPASRVCPEDQECGIQTVQRPVDILNYSRIQSTPLALAAVLGLLALATIAHLLVTSTRRRRRDLAVLKTLGFVRGQVSSAVAWQASTLVIVALLVGIPLGVAAGRWVWQLFADQLGVPPAPRIPTVAVVLAVPVALIVANVLAAGPGWVAGRLRPATVLRTE